MSMTFEERLNRILPRITSDDFLLNRGMGNEIGFWIFDYPPEDEVAMRAFVREVIEPALARQSPPLRFKTIDLFALMIEVLRERGLLDKVIQMQADKGAEATLPGLRSVLREDKVAQRIAAQADVESIDLLMLTGVGAAYPVLRSHTLLSALHPLVGNKPVLMFFPGSYNGFSLSLFDRPIHQDGDHYYRAFRLVD